MTPVYGILTIILGTVIITTGCNEGPPEGKLKAKAKERGAMIADSTQQVLAANLKMAIQEGGLKNAIQYCNLQAMPLTQEMEKNLVPASNEHPPNPATQKMLLQKKSNRC